MANHRLSGNGFKSCDLGFKNLKNALMPILGWSDHALISIPDDPAGNSISLSELPDIIAELEPIKNSWAADDNKKHSWDFIYLSALIQSMEYSIVNNENFQFLGEN